MSGIAGICGPTDPKSLGTTVQVMLQTIAHRGPDGQGVWADPGGACGLGHCRVDLPDPPKHPLPYGDPDGQVRLTLDGGIHNAQDIARRLREKGRRLRTHSDAEVIAHAWLEWGPECVSRFNGEWALALWDARRRTLFCSCDRLGVKPLYYTADGATVAVASEIKALLAAGTQACVNPDGLRQYLAFQFCLDQTTLFDGVSKLPGGCNLVVRPGQPPQVTRWWDLRFDIDQTHDEAWFADTLNRLVQDAVRVRLHTDAPIGVYLSGGLDSSTVACTLRLLLGDAPIRSFTGAYREGEAYDESRYARLVADAAGTDHAVTYISVDEFPRSIETILWHLDQPGCGPGVFGQYVVAGQAARHAKVLFGGEGGDELFIGYARYLVAYLEECLRGAITGTAGRAEYVATLGTIIPNLTSLQHYVPMLRSFWAEGLFEDPAARYYRLMDRFADSRSLLAADVAIDEGRTFEEFRAIFDSHGAAAMINRILNFDLKAHLQALLQVDDRVSAARGLESSTPLLDYRLAEFIATVPPVIKFRNGQLKYLFRQAIRTLLPAEILNRKDKMGFPLPLAQWFAGALREFVGDILLSPAARQRGLFDPAAVEAALTAERPYSRALWGALCLELWHRRFIDANPDAEMLRR